MIQLCIHLQETGQYYAKLSKKMVNIDMGRLWDSQNFTDYWRIQEYNVDKVISIMPRIQYQ